MHRSFFPLAVLILLTAAALRINQLETYPPGPHYDEAVNVLIGRSIVFGSANLFPIANSYQGRETLYHYLTAPLLHYVVDDVFAFQIVSVFANLLTIAASMALGRVMFRGNRGVVIALAVGVLMTISFHQLWLSRQAYRAVTLPMMQALGLLYLWRGLFIGAKGGGSTIEKRENRFLATSHPPDPKTAEGERIELRRFFKFPLHLLKRGFRDEVRTKYRSPMHQQVLRILRLALGGIFCAGALYTYMASRLFPVWLLLAGLALLGLDRANWRRRLGQGVVFFGVMALAAMPIVVYALNHPDIFFRRLDEVSGGDMTVSLAESIRRHAAMFFLHGDFGNLRYNVPGRPYFTSLEGLFMIVGIGVALWRLMYVKRIAGASYEDAPANSGFPLERTAYFLALLSPLMVIPAVISVGGYPPSHMRSLGMVPMIFILVAVGFEAVLSVISRYLTIWRVGEGLRPSSTTGMRLMVLVVGALLVGGISVSRTYFAWARRADLFYQADGDLNEVVNWLPTQVDDLTRVYVASFHREHPTVLIGWNQPVIWLGTDSLFLPPEGREGLVVFAHDTPPAPEWLALLQPYQVQGVPPGPDGGPAFWAYRIPPDLPMMNVEMLPAAVRNPFLSLVGVQKTAIPSGTRGEIIVIWRVEQTPPYARLRPILTLHHPSGGVLYSGDVFLMGTDQWLPGEVIFQKMRLDVPPGIPPGDYALSVTWVDRDTDTYLSYVHEDGSHAGITAELGTVVVTRPEQFPHPDVLPIVHRQSFDITAGIRLLGWNPSPVEARPGELIKPVLFWQATPSAGQREDLEYRVVLRSTVDTVIWQGAPDYPPRQWLDGELVTEYVDWMIPYDQPEGDYSLILSVGDDEVNLGSIHVGGLPRVFEAPPVGTVVGIAFHDSLILYGYTLSVDDTIRLDLVWLASGTPSQDYTVFVHLVGDRDIPIAQFDRMPVDNTYPTSLWIRGEYVEDHYEFANVPPGSYTLRFGLYVQSNGQRLSIVGTPGSDYIEIYEVMLKN